MNQTRKLWVSAAVVGAVIAGGLFVAATASAGALEKMRQETRAVVEDPARATPPATPQSSPDPSSDVVVSHELNDDPEKVVQYWFKERMEQAEPMPMPTLDGIDVSE
ncbi:hypothetical protein [Thermoactinospora rubra]|uniref:hypothetical protein n=1 Tax=Thermoactinospora rubra TaxID=1088767 RepID=UPI000A11F52F|nr:hypothetical protein [Thermoactinospora rubra]